MTFLSNPIVLITGANRGIGYSTVQALSLCYPNGKYIIGCRSLSSGHEAIQELQKLGVTALLEIVEIDVTKDSKIEKAQSWIEEKFGRLDGIFPQPSKHHTWYLISFSSSQQRRHRPIPTIFISQRNERKLQQQLPRTSLPSTASREHSSHSSTSLRPRK